MKAFNIAFTLLIIVLISACSGGGSSEQVNSASSPSPVVLQSIQINNIDLNLVQGTQTQVSLIGKYSDNTQTNLSSGISWSSSDENVLSISSSGRVNAISPGTVTITAEVDGVSSSSTITIDVPTLTSIALSSDSSLIGLGTETQLIATGTFNNGISNTISHIQFSSSDESIATVNDNGIVTAISEGTVIITGELDNMSASLELTVLDIELVGFNVQLEQSEIAAGTSTKVSAIGTFSNASSAPINVQWRSSNKEIATINQLGVIEALTPGQIEITAIHDNELSDPITLTVTNAVAVGLTPIANESLALGLSTQITAEMLFSNDTTQPADDVQWVSSNSSIASLQVNDDIVTITGNAIGSATIFVNSKGFLTSFNVTVTQAVVQTLEFVETDLSLPSGTTTTTSLMANLSDGSQTNVTELTLFSLSPSSIGSIGAVENKELSITGLETGSAQLTGSYKGFSAQTNITVTDAIVTGLVIESGHSTQIPLGESQQLEVKVVYSDGSKLTQPTGVVWQVTDSTIGSIQANGSSIAEVFTKQVGPFDVNVSYLSFSVSFDVFVIGAEAESLTISTPEVFLNDTSKRVSAEFVYSDGSVRDATESVIWSVDDTNIALVENTSPNQGLILPQSVGNTTVRASYNGGELNASDTLDIQPTQLEKGFELLDYMANDEFSFGSGNSQMTVQFTQISETSIGIQALNGGEISSVNGVNSFSRIDQTSSFNFGSGSVTLTKNSLESIAVLKNSSGVVGLLQIHEVRVEDVNAGSNQVAFSWAVRVDGEDDFSKYVPSNKIKLLTCVFAECTQSSLPRFIGAVVVKNEDPKPTHFSLGEFVLISLGEDYRVANLRANELSNISTLSFDGLIDNQLISQGHSLSFNLLATPTSGETVNVDYFFDIEGLSELSFIFQGTLETN